MSHLMVPVKIEYLSCFVQPLLAIPFFRCSMVNHVIRMITQESIYPLIFPDNFSDKEDFSKWIAHFNSVYISSVVMIINVSG